MGDVLKPDSQREASLHHAPLGLEVAVGGQVLQRSRPESDLNNAFIPCQTTPFQRSPCFASSFSVLECLGIHLTHHNPGFALLSGDAFFGATEIASILADTCVRACAECSWVCVYAHARLPACTRASVRHARASARACRRMCVRVCTYRA